MSVMDKANRGGGRGRVCMCVRVCCNLVCARACVCVCAVIWCVHAHVCPALVESVRCQKDIYRFAATPT